MVRKRTTIPSISSGKQDTPEPAGSGGVFSVGDRFQQVFQLCAKMRVLAGKFQSLPKVGDVFVPVETGLIGGHLEKDTPGGAEVDRPEVIPVNNGRDTVAGVQQRLAHLKLCSTVVHAKGDVMHAPRALVGLLGFDFGDVDHIRCIAARYMESGDPCGLVRLFVAHETQKLCPCGSGVGIQSHLGGLKATDRNIFGDAVGLPWLAVVICLGQGKAVSIRALKQEAALSHARVERYSRNTVLSEPRLPERQASLGDGKSGGRNFTGTGPARGFAGKREIGHDRAGGTVLVPVVQMVDLWVVEIHGLLDPAQPKHLGEKIAVGLSPAGERGDVVQSVDLGDSE